MNIKLILYALFGLFLSVKASAQFSVVGTPFSIENSISFSSVPSNEYNFNNESLDLVANSYTPVAYDSLIDSTGDVPEMVYLYHQKIDLYALELQENINPLESGRWDVLPGGKKIWRIRIRSSNVLTFQFAFHNFLLNAGEKIYIYDINHNLIQGAFSKWNNDSTYMKLYTAKNPFKDLIIEYNLDAGFTYSGWTIGRVIYGFKDCGSNAYEGSCSNNVNCAEYDDWCKQIRSALSWDATVTKGSGANGIYRGCCSGALINNFDFDAKGYVITAAHCLINTASQLTVDVNSTLFYFNNQSPVCSDAVGNKLFTAGGNNVELVYKTYSAPTVDGALFLIKTGIPLQHNVYYTGFDAHNISQSTLAKCIHHPLGDNKNISNGAIRENTLTFLNKDTKIVKWNNSTGTKSGSSGAPIYRDDNQLLTGTLTGSSNPCSPRDYIGLLRRFLYPNTPLNQISKAGKALFATSNNTSTITSVYGYDPIAQCKDVIHLNDKFHPAEIYRANKPNITIQAGNIIHIADLRPTLFNDEVFRNGMKQFSNYTFQAGNQIKVYGNHGGFKIPYGHKGYFKIQECVTSQGCGINYFNKNGLEIDYENISPTSEANTPEINAYPNPGKNTIWIENAQNHRYMISDMIGNKISLGNINLQKEEITISELLPGIYLLYLVDNNNVITTLKIIKL